jgi:hypothetical protein
MSMLFGFIPLLGCNVLTCESENGSSAVLRKADAQIREANRQNKVLKKEKDKLRRDMHRLQQQVGEKQMQIGALLEENARFTNERGNIMAMLHKDQIGYDDNNRVVVSQPAARSISDPQRVQFSRFGPKYASGGHGRQFVEDADVGQQPQWMRQGPSRNAAGLSPVPRGAVAGAPASFGGVRLPQPPIGV